MTDLETAKEGLVGNTLSVCKNNVVMTSKKRGVAAMLDFIDSAMDLTGFTAADLVVGKAAAILFVKAGITRVYAKTLSEGGKAVLEEYRVQYSYETLTEKILNRAGTGTCPMEAAVAEFESIEDGYGRICKAMNALTGYIPTGREHDA